MINDRELYVHVAFCNITVELNRLRPSVTGGGEYSLWGGGCLTWERTYVPQVLCSAGPMFPGSYVGGGGQIVANIAIYVGIIIIISIYFALRST